jgi:RNA polymerase sigma factor (sigma-70 family)
MNDLIPSVILSDERLSQNLKTMRKGNERLKVCAEALGMDNVAFRKKILRGSFNPAEWLDLSTEQMVLVTNAIPYIQAVQSIEMEMLSHNVRFLHQQSRKWVEKIKGGSADADDFFQEAAIGLVDAIYGYTRDDIAFSTFFYYAIAHRLQTAVEQMADLSTLNKDAKTLMELFELAKHEVNRPANETEIMDYMGITNEERKLLIAARRRVNNASTINQVFRNNGMGPDVERNDYTYFRAGFDEDAEPVVEEVDRNETVAHVRLAIEKAKLTDLERVVLDHFMKDGHGWQAQLARNVTNPSTGQPYTRAGIGNILQTAQKKVGKAMLRIRRAA